ncbi:hypothetical protein B0J13DRAFT_537511 [Dactylonectria estremocensis]|uniref:Uncharacterized protein n=1 Tax=Dactylonectria estremocensis TaxID=1079267 RepID=A0A9P9JIN1_9HYPO|nr:hypothetical protein B0J13DRAFT_537511 [Dactylonectria estremocensis]
MPSRGPVHWWSEALVSGHRFPLPAWTALERYVPPFCSQTRHGWKPANPTKPPIHLTAAPPFCPPPPPIQSSKLKASSSDIDPLTCKISCMCKSLTSSIHNNTLPSPAMSTSADTTPISPARFAAALKDLSVGMLHLKVLEIRNSIAHLQYSNDQLKPFAEGSETAADAGGSGPDQDCVDAIRENELVIDRMAERVAIIRAEVEERGLGWNEFQSRDEAGSKTEDEPENINGTAAAPSTLTSAPGAAGNPWTDGTFQVGTIRNGEIHMDAQPSQLTGGSLSDEQLRRALEERMRDLATDDDNDEGGMHL